MLQEKLAPAHARSANARNPDGRLDATETTARAIKARRSPPPAAEPTFTILTTGRLRRQTRLLSTARRVRRARRDLSMPLKGRFMRSQRRASRRRRRPSPRRRLGGPPPRPRPPPPPPTP